LPFYSAVSNIKKFSLRNQILNNPLDIEDLEFVAETNNVSDKLSGSITISLEKLDHLDQMIGPVKTGIMFNSFNLKPLKKLKESMLSLYERNKSDPVALEKLVSKNISVHVPKILAGNPSLSILPTVLSLPDGNINFKIDASFVDLIPNDFKKKTALKKLRIKSDTSISKKILYETIAQQLYKYIYQTTMTDGSFAVGNVSAYKTKALEGATTAIDRYISGGYLVENDDNYAVKFTLDNDKFSLNSIQNIDIKELANEELISQMMAFLKKA